jgi:ubiquinone/menaquinone biosynthesis C-methylase UbiE
MAIMTKDHLHADGNQHDYLPAAGHDALLPGYDLMARLFGFAKVYATLIAQADVTDNHRVLEIGCGTGNLTTRLKRAHPSVDVIGSDPDPDPLALNRARRKARKLSGIRFDLAYAQQLPYGDAEFDRVLSSMMLHHLVGEAKAAAVAEVFRVLRPGGRLHVVDIGGDVAQTDGLAGRFFPHSPHAAGNLDNAIPRLLGAAGFDCTELATRRHPVIGRLSYYRATRPAS